MAVFCRTDDSNWDASFEHVLDGLEKRSKRPGDEGARAVSARAIAGDLWFGQCSEHLGLNRMFIPGG